MNQRPSRGRRRSRPVLRHHLEDEFDRELDRLFGQGRTRRRDGARRNEQYARLAKRLLEQVIERELDDLEGCRLAAVLVHAGGALLTLDVELPDDLDEPAPPAVVAIEGRLRSELATHLPRRRTSSVRLRFVPRIERGGEG